MIKYKSTRGSKKQYTFSEAILKGIADDGGLLVPEKLPKLSIDQLDQLTNNNKPKIKSINASTGNLVFAMINILNIIF